MSKSISLYLWIIRGEEYSSLFHFFYHFQLVIVFVDVSHVLFNFVQRRFGAYFVSSTNVHANDGILKAKLLNASLNDFLCFRREA